MAAGPPRPGYRSVNPRIFVDDVEGLVDFLRRVFGAAGDLEPGRPAEIDIGDSRIMISPTGLREPFPAFLYIYVDDVDSTYGAALAAGATSVEPPAELPYGDYRAMFEDPFSNIYQVAQVLR
jgi:PhnB protein